ncbi:hypothetical protein LguiA_012689 [Lonicera macranthoides]
MQLLLLTLLRLRKFPLTIGSVRILIGEIIGLEKTEVHKNWQSKNRRSSREVDKPQPHERPHSLDTWRKPIEQPASHDPRNWRYEKPAFTVELAQAFSTSILDPKTASQK